MRRRVVETQSALVATYRVRYDGMLKRLKHWPAWIDVRIAGETALTPAQGQTFCPYKGLARY
jgi:hypothetical protein